MIIVTMKMKVCMERRGELLDIIQKLVKPARMAPGCISYRFYRDIENGDTFCSVEEWETQADLDTYFRSDAFKSLLEAMSHLDEPPDIKINAILHISGWETVETARSWK